MFRTIKTALAAVIALGSIWLAPAQAFAAYRGHHHPGYEHPAFQGRDVSLPSTLVPPPEEQWFDRATQSFGGGK
jgi:hypothetical protein